VNAPAAHARQAVSLRQAARTVLMVRPQSFCCNPQTLASNAFQQPSAQPAHELLSAAQREFDESVRRLQRHGLEVLLLDEPADAGTPDALYPNNWFSTHADGTLVLYPMAAANRRLERRPEALRALLQQHGFQIRALSDLSGLEPQAYFVEGTGSLVLDRVQRIAYAARSARTTDAGVAAACEALGFEALPFSAIDRAGRAVYHTNVLMSVGPSVALIAAELIPDLAERTRVIASLERSAHEVLLLDAAQLNAFAGNVLFLENAGGDALLAISSRAWESLTAAQRTRLERAATPIVCDVTGIEAHGGGGIRCMLAEIFLPRSADHGLGRGRPETSLHGVSRP
jgi:hypothetical protein